MHTESDEPLARQEVTRILNSDESEIHRSAELLPIVYEQLRALARRKMAGESPGHTLQATALVHEAYIRLLGQGESHAWENRAHFFVAAAEAMRRILVDRARYKAAQKRGGPDKKMVDIDAIDVCVEMPDDEILRSAFGGLLASFRISIGNG